MQSPSTGARFAVYGHGEVQKSEDPRIEAGESSSPAGVLEEASPKLEAAFYFQNKR
jgi:hypothetical protein